jgi:ornithine carbamoyltransferase
MKSKDFLTIGDQTSDELWEMLNLAAQLKSEVKNGVRRPVLAGKVLAMVFQKPSLRTRVSFAVGMEQLGGTALYLSPEEVGLGTRESVPDVARVLSRFVDGIMARVFSHQDVETLAKYASVPVINGLSDFAHPCQALADLLTIWEHFGHLDGLTLAYVGDGNNVAHSLLMGSALVGMNVSLACPPGYEPSAKVLDKAKEIATNTGATIQVLQDPQAAVVGADVIYTDVWTSMGQEAEYQSRLKIFAPYQINAQLVAAANPSAIVLHCLPAHRGEEITADVIESSRSLVFEQAENRLHAQKAVLVLRMGNQA